MQILKILSKKTIVKVRGGGSQRSMVKDHTFALFHFGTLPLSKKSCIENTQQGRDVRDVALTFLVKQ